MSSHAAWASVSVVACIVMILLGYFASSKEDVPEALLGERLFFDVRLSANEERACSTCHDPEDQFGGPPRAAGEVSVPSLLGVGRQRRMGRANPLVVRLEDQTRIAIVGEDPVEMGFGGGEHVLSARLREDSVYCEALLGGRWMWGRCVGGEAHPARVLERVIDALATYQRTLEPEFDTSVDRWLRGEEGLEGGALEGARVFYGDAGCVGCHGGEMFSQAYRSAAEAEGGEPPMYVVVDRSTGQAARPLRLGQGLQAVTANPDDFQRFKVPTLRGIARRDYFFHHGARMTLEEAIISHAPQLSDEEHEALTHFIRALE